MSSPTRLAGHATCSLALRCRVATAKRGPLHPAPRGSSATGQWGMSDTSLSTRLASRNEETRQGIPRAAPPEGGAPLEKGEAARSRAARAPSASRVLRRPLRSLLLVRVPSFPCSPPHALSRCVSTPRPRPPAHAWAPSHLGPRWIWDHPAAAPSPQRSRLGRILLAPPVSDWGGWPACIGGGGSVPSNAVPLRARPVTPPSPSSLPSQGVRPPRPPRQRRHRYLSRRTSLTCVPRLTRDEPPRGTPRHLRRPRRLRRLPPRLRLRPASCRARTRARGPPRRRARTSRLPPHRRARDPARARPSGRRNHHPPSALTLAHLSQLRPRVDQRHRIPARRPGRP